MQKVSIILLYMGLALTSFSQAGSTIPVYIRYPGIPQFTIYKAPDSAKFTREDLKKKPAVFVIFDPGCDHCQQETKAITANIDKFKNVQIIMVTYLPYKEMVRFYHDYKIGKYAGITMGFDAKSFFPLFFHVTKLPAVFIYDKKGNYKTAFEGPVNLDKIVASL